MEVDSILADPHAAAADELWTACAACHGDRGLGDGMAAPALGMALQSFADPEWHAANSDEVLGAVIVDGGAAHGMSPFMPANPKLAKAPDLLASLVRKLRSFESAGQ